MCWQLLLEVSEEEESDEDEQETSDKLKDMQTQLEQEKQSILQNTGILEEVCLSLRYDDSVSKGKRKTGECCRKESQSDQERTKEKRSIGN